MGAVYYVELSAIPSDEESLRKKLGESLEAEFSDFKFENQSIDEMFKILLGGNLEHTEIYKRGDVYTSSFEAAYMWELALNNVFCNIASALRDDSYIYIEPDNECYTLKVRGGVAS